MMGTKLLASIVLDSTMYSDIFCIAIQSTNRCRGDRVPVIEKNVDQSASDDPMSFLLPSWKKFEMLPRAAQPRDLSISQ
jgi:hypothetical protein